MKSPSLVTSHFGPLQPAIERARLLPDLGVLRQEDGAPQTAVPGFVPGSPPSAAAIERLIVRARQPQPLPAGALARGHAAPGALALRVSPAPRPRVPAHQPQVRRRATQPLGPSGWRRTRTQLPLCSSVRSTSP